MSPLGRFARCIEIARFSGEMSPVQSVRLRVRVRIAILSALIACAVPCVADEIRAAPGKGTISEVAAKATAGDVILLESGEYEDAFTLGAGVTLRGAGAEMTILRSSERVVVRASGPRVTVCDLTIRGDGETLRAVDASGPVRVERVRIVEVKEAIALMGAPLSDIVACEFVDCGIGVRAIAEASPTVYGCVFSRGRMGVFAMGGAPYVENNAFVDLEEGVRAVPKGTNQAMIRNNLFLRCAKSGVVVAMGQDALSVPMIRNSIFQDCPVAIITPKSDIPALIKCAVLHNVPEPAVRDEKGEASLELAAHGFAKEDPGLTFGKDFSVTITHQQVVVGKGVRRASEPQDVVSNLGPTLSKLGVSAPVPEGAMMVRWNHPKFIANSVSEEYQAMRVLGLRSSKQATMSTPNGQQDIHTGADGATFSFDISRFYGENSLKP